MDSANLRKRRRRRPRQRSSVEVNRRRVAKFAAEVLEAAYTCSQFSAFRVLTLSSNTLIPASSLGRVVITLNTYKVMFHLNPTFAGATSSCVVEVRNCDELTEPTVLCDLFCISFLSMCCCTSMFSRDLTTSSTRSRQQIFGSFPRTRCSGLCSSLELSTHLRKHYTNPIVIEVSLPYDEHLVAYCSRHILPSDP